MQANLDWDDERGDANAGDANFAGGADAQEAAGHVPQMPCTYEEVGEEETMRVLLLARVGGGGGGDRIALAMATMDAIDVFNANVEEGLKVCRILRHMREGRTDGPIEAPSLYLLSKASL